MRAKAISTAALKRRLRAFVPDAEKEMDAAKEAGMADVASKIAARAPYRTGEYHDSIKAGLVSANPQARKRPGYRKPKDGNAVAIFGNFVWRFLEFGTAPHVNGGMFEGSEHPGSAAQPHVFPTWRANRNGVKKAVRAGLNKAVKKSNAGRRRNG